MSTITRTITGDTASSLTMTSIVRTDTGAALSLSPALPQPFTNAGGGAWTFTFTDPSAGLTYNYAFVVTWPDGSSDSGSGTFASTATPVGMWGTLDMVKSIYSASNINLWPQDPQSTNPVSQMEQGAFNRADSDIATEFAKQKFVLPGPTHPMATKLGWIEAELMGVYLYESNGLQDAAKGIDGKMTSHRAHALSELDELLWLNRGGFARVTGYSDAPIAVAPTVTPGGDPVAKHGWFPTPKWNGYSWQWC